MPHKTQAQPAVELNKARDLALQFRRNRDKARDLTLQFRLNQYKKRRIVLISVSLRPASRAQAATAREFLLLAV